MCRMCEGFSLDDVLALDAAQIAEYGFVIIGVEGRPPDHGRPWAYTIGLLDAADHPELIIAGPSLDTSGPIISALAHSVLDDGDRYEPGDTIDLGDLSGFAGDAVVGSVHEIHYALDTFNMWHNLQEYGALRTAALEAVQIVLSPEFFCPDHRHSQPVLASRESRVGQPAANRAARRRRPRRRSG